MPKVTVTKPGAAGRQLCAAIRLFLGDGDPVAIHTLASAAAQITADLMKAKGMMSIVRSAALVREDRRKEVLRTMAAPENFFKHADRDPDEAIEFNPETTEFFIFAALAELQAMTGRLPREGQVFQMWFLLKHEGMLLESDQTRVIRQALDVVRRGSGLAKSDFLQLLSA
jgi:hypothetical protein